MCHEVNAERLFFASWLIVFWTTTVLPQTPTGASWLDRSLANWNVADHSPTATPDASDRRAAIRERCRIPPSRTDAHRVVETWGWIPYDHLDRSLSQGDLEIVAGMTDADAMCRPVAFQIFVFVGGKLAGTLSPEVMTTGLDASAGAVRILTADTISAEFARYANQDAPCCPTSRVAVRYEVHRSGSQPSITPVDIRTTRSQ